MEEKRKEFYFKIKSIVRNNGKSNFISLSDIDELLNEYYEYNK